MAPSATRAVVSGSSGAPMSRAGGADDGGGVAEGAVLAAEGAAVAVLCAAAGSRSPENALGSEAAPATKSAREIPSAMAPDFRRGRGRGPGVEADGAGPSPVPWFVIDFSPNK
ncbi:hypothetical protein GCM10007175_25850 [Pseudarthrobacter scleromae]|uniref:Uncharacterized protein n=1 Tax=Pseudarthrobacter scleromae TaxID=158897 RepID=A0ABQ2CIM5_9MICC|nr:hypothetical protein GCM10007175_25850 [Pseudarthrobacter scleromae]